MELAAPIDACFLSAFGAAGRSFLASHVAHLLSERTAANVGFIDVTPADAGTTPAGRIAARGAGLVSCWHIDPTRASMGATWQRVGAAVATLGRSHASCLIEVPAGCSTIASQCVARSALVYVLTDCSVAGLVGTSRLLRQVASIVPTSRVRIVVNRTQAWVFDTVTPRQAEQHLAFPIAHDIPFDAAVQAGELNICRFERRTCDALEAVVVELMGRQRADGFATAVEPGERLTA
ncbi:MAG: hypothetical protein AB7I50_05515 [Vicinamibacterales bacterium]